MPELIAPGSWEHHMRRGEFAEAWRRSDADLRARAGQPCWHWPRHLQYVWDGRTLAGQRVLVRCYHGLGDTIQFIRYLPLLKDLGAEVIVWAQPALLPLLATAPGIDQLLPLHDSTPEAAYDADVEIMELPHIFRSTLSTIPQAIPYLHVAPRRLAKPGRLAVGVVWQAGDWDARRSVPFGLLAPLAAVPGVELFILQVNAAAAGWQEGIGTYLGEFDLYQYARVVRGLDLLITVDSMPAHLAGALGVPVWTLLHAEADWRWLSARDDSPWYPTMRLFWQTAPGEWAPVVARVQAELARLSLANVGASPPSPLSEKERGSQTI